MAIRGLILLLLACCAVAQAGIGEKVSHLLGRKQDGIQIAPRDLQRVGEIYSQAIQKAQERVAQLQESVGSHWKETHNAIASIYRAADQQSASDVETLRKEYEGVDKKALDTSSQNVHSVWTNAYKKASQESGLLQKHVDEDWASFKRRIASIWEEANREAERQVDSLLEKASEAANDAEFEDGDSALTSFKQKMHKVKDSAQGTTSTLVDAAKSGYGQLRDQVTHIYRQAASTAKDQLSQLKHGAQDSWESTQSRIAKIYHDAADQAESKVLALFKREDESLYGQATEGARKVQDWYHQAINAAQRQLGTMAAPSPTTTWQDLKARIMGVYSSELDVVDRRIEQLKQELASAEKRKKELSQATARAHALSEEEAGTWELLKTKIASLFHTEPQPQESSMARAWNQFKGLWGAEPEASQSQSLPEKLSKKISDAWHGGVDSIHTITEKAGWTFNKLRDDVVSGFEEAFRLVQSVVPRGNTGKDELTPEEEEILGHIDAYTRAGERAKIKVTELQPIPGEAFGAAKRRIVDVYIDELEREPGHSFVKGMMTKIRGQLSQALGRSSVSPQQVYINALSKAKSLASKVEGSNENWHQLITQLAHTYSDQFDIAERQLDSLYERVQQGDQSISQETRDDFAAAVALHRSARDAVNAVEKLKPVRHATKQDTLERVHLVFKNAIEEQVAAVKDKDTGYINPGPTSAFKRRLRQFLGYDEL